MQFVRTHVGSEMQTEFDSRSQHSTQIVSQLAEIHVSVLFKPSMYRINPNTKKQEYDTHPVTKEQKYKSNSDGEEVYALDEENKPYYATDGSGQEYYAKIGDEEFTNGTRYRKDKDGNEFYPTTKVNNVIAEKYDERLKYAKDSENNEIYAKTKGTEYIFKVYAKDKDGSQRYPLSQNDRYYYAKDSNNHDLLAVTKDNDQMYATDLKKTFSIYPQTSDREEFYAKDRNGREYYGFHHRYPFSNEFLI